MVTNLGITNLEDNTIHFAYSDIVNKLISVDEWRNIQLNEILN